MNKIYFAAILFSLILVNQISFASAEEMKNITVYGKNKSKNFSNIKNDIVKTEIIGAREIEKSNAQNLNQAVDNRVGVSVQLECSVCNSRNINLNNMPGRFTTLMIDGIPIFSSVSNAYGIDSINVRGVESIEISRGAAASLIAPEALAGSVNIVTKRPVKTELEVKGDLSFYNGNRDNNHAKNSSIYLAVPFEKSAATFSFSNQQHDKVDNSGVGIAQFSGFERNLFGAGYFLDDVAGFKIKGRVDLVNEDRLGGSLGENLSVLKTDSSGNPFDFRKIHKGSQFANGFNAPDGSGFVAYDEGLSGFAEQIKTDRVQLINSGVKNTDYGKIKIAGGYANHKQDSFYEKTLYKARQNQYYAMLNDEIDLSAKSSLTIGSDFRYEDLKSFSENGDGQKSDGIDNYKYVTHGVFVQLYNQFFEQKLETNLSTRLDNHNVFGNIFVPRANALYHHNDEFTSRASLGTGYRAPTSFFEQEHGILDTTKIVRQINEVEKSENASYSLNYATDKLDATLSYNYNKIKNFASINADAQIDGESVTLFSSSKNPVTVQGYDLSLSYKITSSLTSNFGYERFFYRFDSGALAYSRPDQKAYFGLDYERKNIDLFTKINWTGNHNLKKFYNYGENQRYNLDGSQKINKSPSFFTVDAGGEVKVVKNVGLYFGVTNLFDYLQIDHDSQLWLDSAGGIDVTQIWGPNQGRHVYAGLKLSY